MTRTYPLFILSLLGSSIPCLCQCPENLSVAGDCPASIGIVLSGGGSFGAFEAGAVKAFFDRWKDQHGGASPPVRVIAGTSTGALIAPFVALGSSGVDGVANLYRNIRRRDILSIKPSILLPFALFAKWSSSAYSAGPLKEKLNKKIPDPTLPEIANMWPNLRLVVLATGFGKGWPAPFTNSPEDMGAGRSKLRDGVLASAASPLAMPPVYIKPGPSRPAEAYLDGGIHAVAPFQALFELAARSPEIELTHVVVFSAYPPFPGNDSQSAQRKRFPGRPEFREIGSRMDALISESSITKEIGLAWAAIELRNAGLSAEKVKERTGLYIAKAPRELILVAPDDRLGWDNLRFNENEMKRMFELGYKATPRPLIP